MLFEDFSSCKLGIRGKLNCPWQLKFQHLAINPDLRRALECDSGHESTVDFSIMKNYGLENGVADSKNLNT